MCKYVDPCNYQPEENPFNGSWLFKEAPLGTVDSIREERDEVNGGIEAVGEISQRLKEIIRSSENWSMLDDAPKEALDMICHKLARILSGDPENLDHWVDIEGYANTISTIIREYED